MGIYRGQFLLGDKIRRKEDDRKFWVISVQMLGANIYYILLDCDSLDCSVKEDYYVEEEYLLEKRSLSDVGEYSILCNICPLKGKIVGSCGEFCNYYEKPKPNPGRRYFFCGDRVKIDPLTKCEEITSILLSDLESPFGHCYDIINKPFLDKNFQLNSALISRLINNNVGILSNLESGNITVEPIIFWGDNYNRVNIDRRIKLSLRTKYAWTDNKEIISYFRELVCDEDELSKFKNSWKLWID